jgi:hypothetical protein
LSGQHGSSWFAFAATCVRSVTVVTVWGIAISIVARIEATIPAVKPAAIPAVETTPVSAVKMAAVSAVKTSAVKTSAVKTSAVKTSAVKTSAVKTSAKAVGLGSTNANRGGERDRKDRNSYQQLAGHGTLLFTFRLRHRMFDRYAGARLACLAKRRCLAC